MNQRWIGIAAATVLMVTGCSTSDDDLAISSPAPIDSGETTVAQPPDTDSESDVDTAATEPPTVPVSSEPQAQTAVADGAQTYGDLGLARVDLLTFGSGLGFRPTLEWTPIEGAAQYEVTVSLPGAGPYWAWSGATSAVPIGGYPLLEPLSAGPALTAPMTWRVVAIDVDGLIVGSSTIGEIAP